MVERSGMVGDFSPGEELDVFYPGSKIREDWKAQKMLNAHAALRIDPATRQMLDDEEISTRIEDGVFVVACEFPMYRSAVSAVLERTEVCSVSRIEIPESRRPR